ncbi:hypothetical protein [Actinocorallia sp. A-T 12471]|uniref:hypothetical protein n=1 Tax=Actinocorallia sp. A-T 12471 TaxID=3089813 RepID=UPI0029CDA625|nr:hypothetical protein [Actinocorallia sp. A-T 12471]MDX6742439.1 hypothetical protein [Actinocorallia sp. A-T 12471]
MRFFAATVVALLAAVLPAPVPASANVTDLRVSLTAVPAGCATPPTLTGLVELERDGVWGPIGSMPQVMVNIQGRPVDLPGAPWIAYAALPATPGVGDFSWPAQIQRPTEFRITAYYGGPFPQASAGPVVLEPGAHQPPAGEASDLRVSVAANAATASTPPTLTGLVEVRKNGAWEPVPSPSLMVYGRPAGDAEAAWSVYGNVESGPDGTYVWNGAGWGPQMTLEFHIVARYPEGFAAFSELVTLELTAS